MDHNEADTERIEREVFIEAPALRVWRAISDAREFGDWFGVTLDGPLDVGRAVHGSFGGELPVAQIEAMQRQLGLEPAPVKKPPEDAVFCTVERVEPESYLSFRWIPFGIDADVDHASEPTTLVEFQLEPSEGGTLLTIRESGFERVPAQRRERAFLMNEAGWAAQTKNIKKYVEQATPVPGRSS